MLKAYAMALVVSVATPVADKSADGVKQQLKPATATTQAWKPGSIRI